MNFTESHDAGILVTRPDNQSGELVEAITHAGWRAFKLPVLDIELRDVKDIARDAADIDPADIIIFISLNAVVGGLPAIDCSAAAIAAIGPATRSALASAGLDVSIYPEGRADSEHLLAHPSLLDVNGSNIVIVRGTRGRELLAETLRSRGARVSQLAVYERRTATPGPADVAQIARHFENGDIDAVVVMSVESLDGLLSILPDDCLPALRKSLLVTPSRRVIQTAIDRLPGTRTALADGPHAAAMVAALFDMKN